MQETWEVFYDLMKAQIAKLLFEHEAAATRIELAVLDAWLVQRQTIFVELGRRVHRSDEVR